MTKQLSASLNRMVIEINRGKVKAIYSGRNLPVKIAVMNTGTELWRRWCGNVCLGGWNPV